MNRYTLIVPAVALSILVSQSALAQMVPGEAQALLELIGETASNNLDGVDHTVEVLQGGQIPGLDAAMGNQANSKCTSQCRVKKTEVVDVGDRTLRVPRLLDPMEAYALAGVSTDAGQLALMSEQMGLMQDTFSENADEMLGPWAGVAGPLMGGVPDNQTVADDIGSKSWEQDERETPWLSPFRMFGAGSLMTAEAARAVARAEQGLEESNSRAQADTEVTFSFYDSAQIVGPEIVNGISATRIDAQIPEDVANQLLDQSGGGSGAGNGEFLPTSASVWVDPDKLVIVQHRIDGIATANGESREFYIENVNADFREVAGSQMYEPYKRVMRMGGVMDEEQMAQMEEARQQLAEFDQQMAAMPPEQRKMVEGMMGSQMDAVRGLANGGAFEYVEIIDEILVNPDLHALFSPTPSMSEPGNLLQQIQVHLDSLGYTPGNTDGVLDAMTQVAISQFQAEQGIAVTGEPSEELLIVLAGQAGG